MVAPVAQASSRTHARCGRSCACQYGQLFPWSVADCPLCRHPLRHRIQHHRLPDGHRPRSLRRFAQPRSLPSDGRHHSHHHARPPEGLRHGWQFLAHPAFCPRCLCRGAGHPGHDPHAPHHGQGDGAQSRLDAPLALRVGCPSRFHRSHHRPSPHQPHPRLSQRVD